MGKGFISVVIASALGTVLAGFLMARLGGGK